AVATKALWIIVFILLFAVMVCTMAIFRHRRSRFIYRASFHYLCIVLISMLSLLVFVLLRSIRMTTSSCMSLPYLTALPITVTLAVIIVNAHRLTTIFLNHNLSTITTTQSVLAWRTLALTLPTLIILF